MDRLRNCKSLRERPQHLGTLRFAICTLQGTRWPVMSTTFEGLKHTWSCHKCNGGLGLHIRGLCWKHLTKPERQMFTSPSDDSVCPLTTHLFPSQHKPSLSRKKLDVLHVVKTVSTHPLRSGLASHECQQRYCIGSVGIRVNSCISFDNLYNWPALLTIGTSTADDLC